MKKLIELFSLEGRTAVVTGASTGLGVEFSNVLAAAGARLALIARREKLLEESASRLRAEHGAEVAVFPADLSDRDRCRAAFGAIVAELGEIDILVNNAGTAPTGRAETQWPAAWDAALEVNLTASFHCSLLAAESMRRGARGGRIINVSSIFGHLGSSLFRLSAYAASKGGIENLTRQLAIEWARDGITVNAVAPAWFPSEMTEGSLKREGVEQRMASANPMGRIGRRGELETACLFLASPASGYITGSVIPVDGGYSAW